MAADDSTKSSKFGGRRVHNQLQRAARKAFGSGNLFKLFARAAEALGEPWQWAETPMAGPFACKAVRRRVKKEGYALLRRALDGPTPIVAVKAVKKKRVYAQTDAFLLSWEWRTLRMRVLKKFGARCQCCGSSAKDGVRIHVDHIKPRSTHPELALVEGNLQVLCEVCNQGKGAWDDTDWRETPAIEPAASPEPIWSGYITKH